MTKKLSLSSKSCILERVSMQLLHYRLIFSTVVGRGIVIHAENGGSSRLACATIEPVKSMYVEKSLPYVQVAGFSK